MNNLLWVAGGRDYTDVNAMMAKLLDYRNLEMTLITGSARGADTLAETMWREWELPYIGIPARWTKQGKSAGPRRNQIIVADWKPTRAVFFPGGRGTAHAVELAIRYDIPYREIE